MVSFLPHLMFLNLHISNGTVKQQKNQSLHLKLKIHSTQLLTKAMSETMDLQNVATCLQN